MVQGHCLIRNDDVSRVARMTAVELEAICTLATGPGQVLFTSFTAAPEIRRRRGWFLFYVLISFFFYTESENLIGRIAQVKEIVGERAWKMTPRSGVRRRSPVTTEDPQARASP